HIEFSDIFYEIISIANQYDGHNIIIGGDLNTYIGKRSRNANILRQILDTENLILLDEAPVYNASHFLGFFSVFNADAIKDIQFYKGAMPANYGGRLSSVMDIRMKDGNAKKFAANAGIGLIASRLNLEGPIGDKASFMISGRRTYADLFLRLSSDSTINQNILYFYDLNAKVNVKINDNNRIFLSGYTGEDKFGQKNEFQNSYGNQTFTFRWNHLFSQKLFSNLTVYTSNYKYNLSFQDAETGLEWDSALKDYGVKLDMGAYLSPRSTLKLGVQGILHKIEPGEIKGIGENAIINAVTLNASKALEGAAYIAHEYDLTNKLKISYGIRYSRHMNIGPDTTFNYNASYELLDTSYHNGNGIYNTYDNFEPRVGLRYNLNENTSLK
ncbi:MAG: TonB-dependent receptor, partial [Bacteroidota bacterium]